MWTAAEWISLSSVLVAGLAVAGSLFGNKWRMTHEQALQDARLRHERAEKYRQEAYERISRVESLLLPEWDLDTEDGTRTGPVLDFDLASEHVTRVIFSHRDWVDAAVKTPDLWQRLMTSALGMVKRFQSRMTEAQREVGWIQHVGWTGAIRERAAVVATSCREVQSYAFAAESALSSARRKLARLEAGKLEDLNELKEALRLTQVQEVEVKEDRSSTSTNLTMAEIWTRLHTARDDTASKLAELSREIRES